MNDTTNYSKQTRPNQIKVGNEMNISPNWFVMEDISAAHLEFEKERARKLTQLYIMSYKSIGKYLR